MICNNCGTDNVNGAKFCKGCGQALNSNDNAGIQTAENGEIINDSRNGKEVFKEKVNGAGLLGKLKSMPKKVLIGICAAAAVLIAIICITLGSSKTINLNKYLSIESQGYDGYGMVHAEIDWKAIEQKYGTKIKFKSSAVEELGLLSDFITPIGALKDCVGLSVNQDGGLKNGDSIEYIILINEEYAKYIDCKLKSKNGEYKISGLEKVETFDAFSDLSVVFDGLSPNGTATIQYSGSVLSPYDFVCDKEKGLRNGDIITVKINDNNIDNIASTFGKVPAENEKTYTVSGLSEYIETYEKLSEEFITLVKKETEDIVASYIAKSYGDSKKASDIKYSGYILNHQKPETYSWGAYNNLYIIYSATVSSPNKDFPTTVVYYPVKFSAIISDQNGISYSDVSDIIGSSGFSDSIWYTTKGYTDEFMCYSKIVVSNADSYDFQCGGNFEKYDGYNVITSLSELDDPFRESIQKNAKEAIQYYVENGYSDGSVASNLSYVGDCLLTAKDTYSLDSQNVYYVIFKASVSSKDKNFKTTDVFFPVKYSGLVKLSNNEFEYLSSAGIQGHNYLPDSYYSTKGYVDGKSMFSELITSYRDSYNYEVSEGIKQYEN